MTDFSNYFAADVPHSSLPPEAIKTCLKAHLRVGFVTVIVARYTREECVNDYVGQNELHCMLFKLMDRARDMWDALK